MKTFFFLDLIPILVGFPNLHDHNQINLLTKFSPALKIPPITHNDRDCRLVNQTDLQDHYSNS